MYAIRSYYGEFARVEIYLFDQSRGGSATVGLQDLITIVGDDPVNRLPVEHLDRPCRIESLLEIVDHE